MLLDPIRPAAAARRDAQRLPASFIIFGKPVCCLIVASTAYSFPVQRIIYLFVLFFFFFFKVF